MVLSNAIVDVTIPLKGADREKCTRSNAAAAENLEQTPLNCSQQTSAVQTTY